MNPLFAFSSTFILGALHALEPGHGKSFIAAYMLGNKTSFRHVMAMLGSMLVSHFLLLAVIAVVLMYLFREFGGELMLEIIEWTVPVIVMLFGGYLLYRAIKTKGQDHVCCDHHHEHGHNHDHSHDQAHSNNAGVRKSAIAGFVGGLLPCPSAVAALGFSGMTSQFTNVLWYLVVYILGMALVMLSIMLVLHFSKRFASGFINKVNSKVNIQLVSAILIILVGVVYFSMHMFLHPHHVDTLQAAL